MFYKVAVGSEGGSFRNSHLASDGVAVTLAASPALTNNCRTVTRLTRGLKFHQHFSLSDVTSSLMLTPILSFPITVPRHRGQSFYSVPQRSLHYVDI